jgi:hypothetical protein
MPRFVVLRHETPPGSPRGLHWDFMLEQDGALRTWALAEEPRADCAIDAHELAVHRVAYLQYEGPVSGDRGSVARWDEGDFALLSEVAEHLELSLTGRRLFGHVRLERDPSDPLHWTFRLSLPG